MYAVLFCFTVKYGVPKKRLHADTVPIPESVSLSLPLFLSPSLSHSLSHILVQPQTYARAY